MSTDASADLEQKNIKAFALDKRHERRAHQQQYKIRIQRSWKERSWRYIKKNLYRNLIFLLPESGIPENRYKQRVFVLACTFTVFVLVVFFTSLFLQYETLRKTTFISVEESDGCKPVLATINDQFRFDQKGYWETSAQFQPDLSLFTVDFVGLRMNKANYSALLNKIQVMFTQSSTVTDYFSTADFIMAFSAYQKSAITVLDDGSKAQVKINTISSPNFMFNGLVNINPWTLFSPNALASEECRKLLPEISIMNGLVRVYYRDHFHGAIEERDFEKYRCNEIVNPATFRYKTVAEADHSFSIRSDDFNATVIDAMEAVNFIPKAKPKVEKITLKHREYRDMEFKVDLVSAVVAIAVNSNFLLLDDLAEVTTSPLYFVPKGYKGYIYPKYPLMDCIICNPEGLIGDGGFRWQLCLVSIGSTKSNAFALPVTNSVASDPASGNIYDGLCTCSFDPLANPPTFVDVQQYGPNQNKTRGREECSNIAITYSFVGISLPTGVSQAGLTDQFAYELTRKFSSYVTKPAYYISQQKPGIYYFNFMRAVYNATVVPPVEWGFTELEHAAFVKSSFDFCNGECYVMAINYFGITSTLAPNSVDFANIACSQKIFPSEAIWKKIKDDPPVSLEESFYHCENTKAKALATALGLANGILGLAIKAFVLLLLPLLIYGMEKSGYLHEISTLGAEYDAQDKKVAIEEFALTLLRIRDGDMRGIDSGGEMHKVTQDLLAIARLTANLDADGGGGNDNVGPTKKGMGAIRPSARTFLDLDNEDPAAPASTGNTSDGDNTPISAAEKRDKKDLMLSSTNPMIHQL